MFGHDSRDSLARFNFLCFLVLPLWPLLRGHERMPAIHPHLHLCHLSYAPCLPQLHCEKGMFSSTFHPYLYRQFLSFGVVSCSLLPCTLVRPASYVASQWPHVVVRLQALYLWYFCWIHHWRHGCHLHRLLCLHPNRRCRLEEEERQRSWKRSCRNGMLSLFPFLSPCIIIVFLILPLFYTSKSLYSHLERRLYSLVCFCTKNCHIPLSLFHCFVLIHKNQI